MEWKVAENYNNHNVYASTISIYTYCCLTVGLSVYKIIFYMDKSFPLVILRPTQQRTNTKCRVIKITKTIIIILLLQLTTKPFNKTSESLQSSKGGLVFINIFFSWLWSQVNCCIYWLDFPYFLCCAAALFSLLKLLSHIF